MAKTHPHEVLERAEAAGIKIVVDAATWTDRTYPLVPGVSPDRCELVAEARRLIDMFDTRVDPPPEGVAYAVDDKTLTAAIGLACAYIESVMKGNGNAKSTDNPPTASKSDVADGDDEPDTIDEPGGDAGGKKGDHGSGGKGRRGS